MNLKFKVWCHNKNEWETGAYFLSQNGFIFHMNKAGRTIPLRPDTHTISFFVGVEDDNHKNIYSTDILKIHNPIEQIQKMEIICTLKYDHFQWQIVFQKTNIWEHYHVEPYLKYQVFPFNNFFTYKSIEIIGNVFENANLIE